jgi:hypothetical protein
VSAKTWTGVDGQCAFTVFTRIEGGKSGADAVVAILTPIGDHVATNDDVPFAQLAGLHFASFCAVPLSSGDWYLVFEGNVDGTPADFLRELVGRAGPKLREIYGHCLDFPVGDAATDEAVLTYLLAHDIGADTFYVGWAGWSVERIRREKALRDAIEALVESPGFTVPPDADLATFHAAIRDGIAGDPQLRWTSEPPTRPAVVRYGRLALVGILAALVLVVLRLVRRAAGPVRSAARRRAGRSLRILVGLLVATAVRLRTAESDDERRDRQRSPGWQAAYDEWSRHLGKVRVREDEQVQNHMISVIPIKPGWFRLAVLRTVLWVINLAARLWWNRGELGGIGSIHFARWVIPPDGRDLIFLSNYDGSWESYLDEFIDRASVGLSAVWSNTDNEVGFPATRWLVSGGARDEARFKAFARRSMWPTTVWYSAYPSLSVANIRTNMAIRDDLPTSLDPVSDDVWLGRL